MLYLAVPKVRFPKDKAVCMEPEAVLSSVEFYKVGLTEALPIPYEVNQYKAIFLLREILSYLGLLKEIARAFDRSIL